MRKFASSCLVILLCLLFLVPGATWAMSSTVLQLMREGIALHDIGQYSAAIDTYLQALDLQPDDPLIYYELGYSYMANQQYDQCAIAAQKGLGLQPNSDMEPLLYGLKGSCYSTADRTDEALAAFRTGLAKYPNDTGLNYNIAITLANTQRLDEATQHIKVAILTSPDYTSPYFLLAQLYEAQGELISSLAFHLRFAMLEPNSGRTQYAAYKAYVLANIGIVVEEGGEYKVSINMDKESKGEVPATLNIALKMAMLSPQMDAAKDQATQFVEGLTKFVQICSELDDEELRNTFVWKQALAHLVTLQQKGYLDDFLYYLASYGSIPGANEWLQTHPDAIKELPKYLK
jgi:tetratricopeptide (TPR) repeat protein